VGDVTSDEARQRAAATFDAIRAPRLHSRAHDLFGTRRWWLSGRDYETLWPFADTWSALCTLGSLADQVDVMRLLGAMLRGLPSYSRERDILDGTGDAGFESVVTPPLGSGGDRYYDDNAWLGLALVRHFELTGDPALLRLARRVFAFVVSGWSTETAWEVPGGIRWKEPVSNRSRNTCVNGPAAELALRLHERVGDASYLDWAQRIYYWARRALLGADELYVDQIAPDGSRIPTIWSYNQGSMIGAGVLLARQTGDPSFLEQAVATAAAYVGGASVAQLVTQDPAFNAVFFRNLFLLDRERPEHRYRALAFDYGTHIWETKRLRHGLFAGQGSPLNNTAAMVQIYALSAGAGPHP
jgi:Glycosyl hydrolase family 76